MFDTQLFLPPEFLCHRENSLSEWYSPWRSLEQRASWAVPVGSDTSRRSDKTHHVSTTKRMLGLCLYHTDSTASWRYERQFWPEGIDLRSCMSHVSYFCPILTKLEFFRQICREGVELLHADARTYGQTWRTLKSLFIRELARNKTVYTKYTSCSC